MVCLLHVSVALVAILREVRYTGYITKLVEQTRKCNILGCKIYSLKYIYENIKYR